MTINYLYYLISFKLAIIISGLVCIVLGYLLFKKGIWSETTKGTTLEANIEKRSFLLKNAAPGTFFALFGIILISVMLYTSSPEVTLKSLKEFESISGEDREDSLSRRERETAEVYLRSIEISNIDSIFQDYNEKLITAEDAIDQIKEALDKLQE